MYQGFYINLDRSLARREALLSRLKAANADTRYQRFAGTDGREVAHRYSTTLGPGKLGCWLSHANVLSAQRSSSVHLHVIEDDIVFCNDAFNLFDAILKYADTQLKDWDLIFTDILFSLDIELFRVFSQGVMKHAETGGYSFVDLKRVFFCSTSSYFVNQRSISKMAALLADKWTAGVPFDIYVRDLVNAGSLRAYLTVPFMTSLAPENDASEIGYEGSVSRDVLYMYRRAFFANADRQAILAELDSYLREARIPVLAEIYVKTAAFALSDQWTVF
jgi:GR25 family glycosyltransferase involved in LPS biosynthesis